MMKIGDVLAHIPTYWVGPEQLANCQLCKLPLGSVMYDSNTRHGWANVCQECFDDYGQGLGTGRGQKYELQADNRWLKTGG